MVLYSSVNERPNNCNNGGEDCGSLINKKGDEFLHAADYSYKSLLETYTKTAKRQKDLSNQIIHYIVYINQKIKGETPTAFGRFAKDENHTVIRNFSPLFDEIKKYTDNLSQTKSFHFLNKIIMLNSFFLSREDGLKFYIQNELGENRTDSFALQSSLAQNPLHFSWNLLTHKDMINNHPDTFLNTTVKNIDNQLPSMKKILNLEVKMCTHLKKMCEVVDQLFNENNKKDLHTDINLFLNLVYHTEKFAELEIKMDKELVSSNLIGKGEQFSTKNLSSILEAIKNFTDNRRKEMNEERKIYLNKLSLSLFKNRNKNKIAELLTMISNVENSYKDNKKNLAKEINNFGSEKMRNILYGTEKEYENALRKQIVTLKKDFANLAITITSFQNIPPVNEHDIL
jgi:hypothetical protein